MRWCVRVILNRLERQNPVQNLWVAAKQRAKESGSAHPEQHVHRRILCFDTGVLTKEDKVRQFQAGMQKRSDSSASEHQKDDSIVIECCRMDDHRLADESVKQRES